jgi:hypothetical protein
VQGFLELQGSKCHASPIQVGEPRSEEEEGDEAKVALVDGPGRQDLQNSSSNNNINNDNNNNNNNNNSNSNNNNNDYNNNDNNDNNYTFPVWRLGV